MAELNNNTDLDKELQQMASDNWTAFVQLIGNDAIIAAKVCMLKNRGKSAAQIASKFRRKKGYARYIIDSKCKPCVVK